MLILVLFLLGIGAAHAQAVLPPIPPAVACIYNATPPTVASGQAVYAQCDAQGRLLNSGGGGGGGGTVTQGPAGTSPWLVTIAPSSAGLSTQATNSLPISAGGAGTSQIIPAVAGKAIYITSWDVVVNVAGTVLLEHGSGVNCATGAGPLAGPYSFPAGNGISKGSGIGAVLFAPAGDEVCIVTSAPLGGSISFAQF